MFDIGFWELAVLAVIGIVVVGPDKLPEVVRTIVVTLRKIRLMFSDMKADIEHELDLDDMRKLLHEADMKAHMNKLNENILSLDKEIRSAGEKSKKTPDERDGETDMNIDDGFTPEAAQEQKDTGEEPVSEQIQTETHTQNKPS